MATTLQAIRDAFGIDYTFANNLVQRGLLVTPVAKVKAGATRPFSRENALEIVLTNIFRRALPLAVAVLMANECIKREREGRLAEYYALNPRTGAAHEFNSEEMTVPAIHSLLPDDLEGEMLREGEASTVADSALQIQTVHLGEIFRRVDKLFQE